MFEKLAFLLDILVQGRAFNWIDMLLKLAWKNIWRNFIRSLIMIFAITLGLWLGIFMVGFVNGLATQRLAFQLENTIAHVKISHQKFSSEKEIKYFVPQFQDIIRNIQNDTKVRAISPRINFRGMAEHQGNSKNVDIYGVNPSQEKATFNLYKFIKQGNYLAEKQSNTIVVGQKFAKILNLQLGEKIKISFQDLEGKLVFTNFKIVGIYQISNTNFEKTHVFVQAKDLQNILTTQPLAHQLAIKIQDYKKAHMFAKQFKGKFKHSKVESWVEIAPDLAYIEVMMRSFFLIFIGIILLGLSLAIINTMLMAVLERKQELNMLRALGMKPRLIFYSSYSKLFCLLLWLCL